MLMFRRTLAAMLAVMLCAPVVNAQQTHVIDPSALDRAVQQRVSHDQSDREALRTFLQNPQVRSAAAKAGLPIEKAEGAVSMLQGDELRQAAGQARTVNQDLAGGDSITLSTTTLIIILLLLILLVVALK